MDVVFINILMGNWSSVVYKLLATKNKIDND